MVIKSIIGTMVYVLSTSVNASLLETDYALPNDGLLTLDTQTNLEWLDLNETAGINAATILSDAGGWIGDGFRYASRDEVVGLIEHAGMTVDYASSGGAYRSEQYENAITLIGLLGWSSTSCADGLNISSNGSSVDVLNICVQNNKGIAIIFEDHGNLGWSNSVYGSLLVRTSAVPIPSAVWLFGSGLLGLIGFARRKA